MFFLKKEPAKSHDRCPPVFNSTLTHINVAGETVPGEDKTAVKGKAIGGGESFKSWQPSWSVATWHHNTVRAPRTARNEHKITEAHTGGLVGGGAEPLVKPKQAI